MTATHRAAKGTIKRKRASKAGVTPGEGDLDFRAIVDASLSGIIVFNDERILYVNQAAAEIVGYTKDELLSMRFWEIIHPDFRDMKREYGLRLLKGEQAESRTETKVIGKDGRERWTDTFVSRIEYRGLPAVLVTAVDITERKQAEEERDRLYDYSLDILCIVGFDGYFKRVSPSIEKILGWKEEELLGKHFVNFTHPDDRGLSIATMEEHENGKEAEFENRCLCKDGTYRWMSWKSHPLVAEKMVIAVGRDITGRKRSEEALKKSEADLDRAQRIAALGSWEWDLKTSTLSGSREYYRIFGMESGGPVPFERFASMLHPDDRKLVEAAVKDIRYDNLPGGYEFRLLLPDGEERYIHSEVEVLRDEKGRPVKVFGTMQDITERKASEVALRRSEEMYRNIVETAEEGIWFVDASGITVFVNRRMAEMLGFTVEEMTGSSVYDYMYEEDKPVAKANFRVDSQGVNQKFDFKFRKREGSRLWVIISTHPLFDEAGKYKGSMAMITDITERKQAEEAVKLANAYNRSLIEASLDPLVTIAPDGRITDVNAATEAVTGYPRNKLIGTDFSDYFSEPAKAREGYRKVFEKGSVIDYPLEIKRVDGHITPVMYNAAVYRDETGTVIGVFAAARDITERKRAEEALRESEALLNSIFRSAPTGIGVVVDRVIKEVNDKLCQMTGYSREELLDENARLFYPSDKEYEHAGKVKYDMIADRGVGEVETRWRRKDGTLIDILLSSSPIAPDVLSTGVTFTALDITKRKRAEDEVKEAKAQAELYLDLLGHDINNMHQIALGYLEITQDMYPESGQSKFLDKPIEVLQRSTQLIKNVRKLQKLHDGMFQTQLVDVYKLLADVQREFGAVPHKTVTLNLNGCDHCQVRANELLHDVFANLVGNAIKHTGDYADIVIYLNIVTDTRGQYCRVVVEDNGPGIPDDFKDKIFNRLLKGTSKAKGMGLGLYLVKSLVDSYDGRVWVEDRIPGDYTKGARFVVMLPAVDN